MNIDLSIKDILFVSPMIVLFLVSLIPITIKVLRGNREPNPMGTLAQGLIGVFVAAFLLIVFSADGQPAFSKALLFDGLTMWLGVLALVATGGAVALAYENPSTRGDQFAELTFLILNSAIGMLILISALDLLMVFIGLEVMSLSLYLMVAMSHEQKLSKEAAFKYFILGSFASAILLYGIAFIFGSTGTTIISDIFDQVPLLISSSRIFLLGIALITVGFCFKVSIAPFHFWTPDVYQGSSTPISAYMSTAIKVASFAAFLRIISLKTLSVSENMLDIMQWLAVITMIVGNVAAIMQNNIKRMLAYSSVSHSGYVLVGLIAAGISAEGVTAASSVIFYLIGYVVMTLGAFAVVSIFEKSENTLLSVDDMKGFADKAPGLALAFSLFMLSLAGVPPLLGFFGKFYLFSSAIQEGLLWLAVWGVINSVISVYYYLRPIVVMYMVKGEPEYAQHSLRATKAAIFVSTILVVSLGFLSDFIFKAVEKSLM